MAYLKSVIAGTLALAAFALLVVVVVLFVYKPFGTTGLNVKGLVESRLLCAVAFLMFAAGFYLEFRRLSH